VSWKKIPRQLIEQKSRFPGQWFLFNCSISASDHVTLWFMKNRKSEEKLQVIDKKIILVSKNIFNITRLTDKDRGFYICRVCGHEKQIFVEILK
ncbi:---NA---, partial [Paramuricea clavata]